MLSVLIPAYKNDETLLRLLDSISRQSITEKIEIIISDDNSIPPLGKGSDFHKYKDQLNIKWYYQDKNLGVLGNSQFLASIAKYKYAVFAQHDDYYVDNNFFERSVNLMNENPKIGFIFGNANFEHSDTPFMVGGEGIEICNGILFSKLFWKKIMTSWSSVIFDNDLLKTFGGFGMEYTISEVQGHQFSTYPQEEGMAFLYLLATERDCVLDWCPVSIRGLPESRFSISPTHPGRGVKNDVLIFVYWNISKLCEMHGERGRIIAAQVRRLAAAHFGLGMLNSDIKIFFGESWRSRLFIITALFMSPFQRLRRAIKNSKHNLKHNLKLLLISLKILKQK